MRTVHKFIHVYPIHPSSTSLILGTIHPHDKGKTKLEFFYGNSNALWLILAKAFPEELSEPIMLSGLQAFLQKRKISISDTILECDREQDTAKDEHLTNIKLNHGLIEQIRKSNISTIYFTSGFGKNNAFKLFYEDILKHKITSEIRERREVILDESIFGRRIKLVVLYSPSGSSNISLAKNKTFLKNKHKYTSSTPVAEFKIDYYRKMFGLNQ